MQDLRNTTALCAVTLILVASVASAQTPIDVPAQPLTEALDELSAETGTPILVRRDLVSGMQSKTVVGPMSTRQALERMLSGTGLSVQELQDDSLVVSNLNFVTQNAIDEEPFDLGTLVLRGELIERGVQDSQTSAVIVTGEDTEARGETELDQTLRRIPGINQGNTLVIRGINADGGLGSATINSTISITVDGIRYSDYRNIGSGYVSTWDLEQVEVLRGPQSTQSGRNALAGAVILESAKPKFTPEYKFRLGLTEPEGYQAAFVVNTPLIDDRLAARLSVEKRDTNANSEDLQTIRGGLLYEPTDRLSFGLNFTDVNDSTEINDVGSFIDVGIQSPSFTADYAINDALTFSSRTQYTEAEVEFLGVLPRLGSLLRDREYDTVEQEFQLSYETDRVRAIGGLFYTNITENSLTDVRIAAGPVGQSLTVEDIETDNYAIYGEVEYDFSPQWTLIAGLRYDVEEVVNTSTANAF